MNARVRGRRAALLLSLALASGGLAASEVASRVQEVDARVGRPVPVLVTRRDVGPGTPLERADLEIRHVPGRFAPTGALTTPDKAIGSEPATAMARGSYVTAALLGGTDARGGPRVLRAGERAVEVGVADGGALTTDVGPGARVDVLVSTEQREGAGVSFIALEDVELLDLRDASGEAPTAPGDADGAAPASSRRHPARDATSGRLPHRGTELRARGAAAATARRRPSPLRPRGGGRGWPLTQVTAECVGHDVRGNSPGAQESKQTVVVERLEFPDGRGESGDSRDRLPDRVSRAKRYRNVGIRAWLRTRPGEPKLSHRYRAASSPCAVRVALLRTPPWDASRAVRGSQPVSR